MRPLKINKIGNKAKLLIPLLPALLFSCASQNGDYYETISFFDLSRINAEEVTNFFDYIGYLKFFEYRQHDYVMKYSESTENYITQKSTHKIATQTSFSKIKKGMDIFEVVRLIGIPYGTYWESATDNLLFKAAESKTFFVTISTTGNNMYTVIQFGDLKN